MQTPLERAHMQTPLDRAHMQTPLDRAHMQTPLDYLMDAENAPDVTAMAAGLLAEVGAVAAITQRQSRGVDPLVHVIGRDGLLARGDQVLLRVVLAHLQQMRVSASIYVFDYHNHRSY